MKMDKMVTFLWSSLLSFCLSLSAAMWLVTAFKLGVDTEFLTVFCLLAAIFCSACYSLPLGPVPPVLGVLSLVHMWQSGDLEAGAEAILNRLSRQYNAAYNWGIIRWGLRTADEMEPTIIIALCILAGVTALVTAWAVCRRKNSFYPVASILYVAACFVVNDTVPATFWLFLLLMTVILLLMTGLLRRQSLKAANRMSLVLSPFVVIFLLVVFLLTPKSAYDRQEDAKQLVESVLGSDPMQLLMGELEGSGSSYNQDVNLTTMGYRSESEYKVMDISAPYTGVLYLRSSAMDTYDGKFWSSSGSSDLPWPTTALEAVGEVSVKTRFAHVMLYLPYYSTYSNLSGIAAGVQNQKNLREYSFTCLRLPSGLTPQDAAKLSTEIYPVNLDAYLHLTPEVKTWAEPLALEITEGASSFSEKAERIASYVRNSARYDLKTARMPGKETDFARWFLEKSETGYCVHFATSTAVLLQAVGIPARYVTGYMTSVTAGEAKEVIGKEAHAWVEYWLPGFGWTVLESTPAAEGGPVATQPGETEETLPQETEAATSPSETTPEGKPQTAPSQNGGNTPNREEPEENRETVAWAVLWVGAAALLLGAAFLQRSLRLADRQKKLRCADRNAQALLHWQECETLSALLKTQPPKALLELAEKAKFSHHTLTTDELQSFCTYRAEAVAQLKKRNIFLQIYYRFVLAKY